MMLSLTCCSYLFIEYLDSTFAMSLGKNCWFQKSMKINAKKNFVYYTDEKEDKFR